MSVKVSKAFLFLLLSMSLQAFAAQRTVFVQLFEWPWQDIARECELYLGPAGFAAVQVSPPHEHLAQPNHPWWERYQVVSYQLNSRSGDEQDFVDMVQRCHRVGVDIYADVVLNHTAGMPQGRGFAGSTFTLYNYPGIYSFPDFHHCGRNGNDHIVNYTDLYELQNCMLVGLADLNTESPYVQNVLATYLNHLIDLGVAGFRLDAAKHIQAQDLLTIKSLLKKQIYIYQEIIYNPSEPIKYSDYTPIGSVTAYNYPFEVAAAFKYKTVDALYNITRGFPDSTKSIVFMTNHDLERNADQSSLLSPTSADPNTYLLSQVYMLSWPFGYPQLYSGYNFKTYDDGPPVDANLKTLPVLAADGSCQAPWTCEHRSPQIAAMVDFHNQTATAFTMTNWWSNGHDQLAYGRGNLGFVVINNSTGTLTQNFQTSLSPGTYCNILTNSYNVKNRSCSEGYEVNSNGVLSASLVPQSAIVLMKAASTSWNDIDAKKTNLHHRL